MPEYARIPSVLVSAMLVSAWTWHPVPAAAGDASTGIVENQIDVLEAGDTASLGFGSGSFVVAPIPFSNPTIGSGLILGAGYLFQIDEASNPSVIGAAAMRSDNGSLAAGLSVNLYFDDNRWQIETLLAEADVRYDLFTAVGNLPIRQDGILGRLSLAYGVTPQLSFGTTLRYLNSTIVPDAPGLPPIPPEFSQFFNVEILNLGVVSDWDTRDSTIYPTSGHALHVEAFHGYSIDGLLDDYNKGYANFTKYVGLYPTGVLAARASVCAASAQTPFFDQCGLGTTDGFRGFSATQFLDRRSASLQVEFRQRIGNRLGAVAFAGLGQVGPSFAALDAGGTHSSYGLGARYRVSKKFPLDFSVDYARNNLDEDTLYIYVGQRF